MIYYRWGTVDVMVQWLGCVHCHCTKKKMNEAVLNIPVYSWELCEFYSVKPNCILINFCLFAGQDDAEGKSLYSVFIHQMSLIHSHFLLHYNMSPWA